MTKQEQKQEAIERMKMLKLYPNVIKDGYAFVYTKNVNDDWCSEFGSICIKSQLGGLVRVA